MFPNTDFKNVHHLYQGSCLSCGDRHSTSGLRFMGKTGNFVCVCLTLACHTGWLGPQLSEAKPAENGQYTPYLPPYLSRMWLKLTQILTSQNGDFWFLWSAKLVTSLWMAGEKRLLPVWWVPENRSDANLHVWPFHPMFDQEVNDQEVCFCFPVGRRPYFRNRCASLLADFNFRSNRRSKVRKQFLSSDYIGIICSLRCNSTSPCKVGQLLGVVLWPTSYWFRPLIVFWHIDML